MSDARHEGKGLPSIIFESLKTAFLYFIHYPDKAHHLHPELGKASQRLNESAQRFGVNIPPVPDRRPGAGIIVDADPNHVN